MTKARDLANFNVSGVLTSTSNLNAQKLTGVLPALNASALTNLTSGNLTGALPNIDGSSLTGIAAGGGGKILGYKTSSGYHTGVNATSTTWTDSNVSIAYTPSALDSRIIVVVHTYVNYLASSIGTGLGLSNSISGGSTTSQLGDPTTGFAYNYKSITGETTVSFEHVDHPNTLSEVTYTVNARRESGSGNAIRVGESNKRSSITVYEISGSSQP